MALKTASLKEDEMAHEDEWVNDDNIPPWEDEDVATDEASGESAEAQPVQPEQPAPQQVAQRTSTAVANPTPQGGSMAVLQDDGLGDLELGFLSFPIVSLRDTFTAGGTDLGTEFEIIVASARPKYIYKVSDDEFVYTYDKQTTTKDEDLNAILAQWKQRNMAVTIKSYRDVTAQVLSGPLEGQLAILSIPQTSVQRFDGYRVTTAVKHNLPLTRVVTRVSRGPKVTGVKFPFYPWSFTFVRNAD